MQGFANAQQNHIGSSAYQSSAIRGRVMSPHVYQWDAAPELQRQTDYRQESGMMASATPQHFSQSLDVRANLREAIAKVYNSAPMLKTKQVGAYSVYNCPVENMTNGPFKYLVAVVPNHEYVPLGSFFSLASLPWVSFQTRNTEYPAQIFGSTRPNTVKYHPPSDRNNPLYDKIKQILEEKHRFVYVADSLPIKVELLKARESETAAQTSTIMSALEAFNTVITMT